MLNLLAAILLGGAMVAAGAAKVAARAAWPLQAREMGAPGWVIPVLPWLELALGAAVIVGTGEVRRGAAVGAMVLLGAFSVQILRILSRGQRPVCACFGSWSARPLGPRHLGRNAGLLLCGLVVLITAVR